MTKLVIILKNKLESIDTILPLINLINPNECIFYCQNNKHKEVLKKNNFLFNEIRSLGKLSIISKNNNFFINKLNNFLLLINLFLLLTKNFKVIHFGKLDRFPFFFLVYLFRSQIIFSESNSFHDERMNLKRTIKDTKIKKKTLSKNIITYNEQNRDYYQNLNCDNLILTGPPRFYEKWQNYLELKSHEYLKKYHPNLNIDEKYIVFFVSSLNFENFLDNEYYESIIEDILKSINKILPNKKILIKPHPTIRQSKLNNIINNVNYKNVFLTYVHPNLILNNADFAITELFSTVMIDAKKMGIPTIEYTKYDKETLLLTNNSSIGKKFIDYFINFNKEQLELTLKTNFIRKPSESYKLNPKFIELINS